MNDKVVSDMLRSHVVSNLARFACAVLLAGTAFAPLRAAAADAKAGAHLFRVQCGLCHSPQPGRNMAGPSLFGIIGRQAGTVPGFHYSSANRNSGIVWNDKTLDQYLANPHKMIPGTIMAYSGLHNERQRQDIIAYLNTLR